MRKTLRLSAITPDRFWLKMSEFLMTPAQHREWARLLRERGLHEKADRQEQLARAIEIRQRQRLSTQSSGDRDRGESRDSSPPTPPDVRVRIRRFGGLSRPRHRDGSQAKGPQGASG